MTSQMLLISIVLMFTVAAMAIGYLIGSLRTRKNIAHAIRDGELSLEQRAIDVSMQIEMCIYKSIDQVAYERGDPWVKIETTKPLIR